MENIYGSHPRPYWKVKKLKMKTSALSMSSSKCKLTIKSKCFYLLDISIE